MKFLDAYIGFINWGGGVGLTPRWGADIQGDSGILNHCAFGATIGVGCLWKATRFTGALATALALFDAAFRFRLEFLDRRPPRVLTSLLTLFKSEEIFLNRLPMSPTAFFTLLPTCATDSPTLMSSSLRRRSYLWVCVCVFVPVCVCMCVLPHGLFVKLVVEFSFLILELLLELRDVIDRLTERLT